MKKLPRFEEVPAADRIALREVHWITEDLEQESALTPDVAADLLDLPVGRLGALD